MAKVNNFLTAEMVKDGLAQGGVERNPGPLTRRHQMALIQLEFENESEEDEETLLEAK